MSFNEQLPEWNSPGAEPPQDKKDNGWQAEEKPPADWFNWLFNRIYKVVQEIRSVFIAHETDPDPHSQYALDLDLNNLAGAGRTNETVKGNADAIALVAAEVDTKETPAGAQAKADAAAAVANAYTDQEVADLGGAGRTTETVKGNADAIAAVQQAVNEHSAETTQAHGGIVPSTRTINGKALSANISLTATDIGASPTSHNHSGVYEPVFTKNTAFNKNFGTTAGTVAEGNHAHSNYVPTSRTVNGKALSANISLTASDVGAEPTLNADQKRKITISANAPSGGADGDVWIVY